MPSASATARRARSTLTAWAAVVAQLVDELLLVLAGASSYCSSVMPWACEPHGEVLEALLHLGVDQRLGHLVVDELGQRLADLLAQRHLGLDLACTWRHALGRSARSSSSVSNSDASVAHSSSSSGSTRSLHLLDEDPEVQGAAPRRGRGAAASNSRIVAGFGAAQLLVELGHDGAAADLVEVVLGGEARRAARRPASRRCRW